MKDEDLLRLLMHKVKSVSSSLIYIWNINSPCLIKYYGEWVLLLRTIRNILSNYPNSTFKTEVIGDVERLYKILVINAPHRNDDLIQMLFCYYSVCQKDINFFPKLFAEKLKSISKRIRDDRFFDKRRLQCTDLNDLTTSMITAWVLERLKIPSDLGSLLYA